MILLYSGCWQYKLAMNILWWGLPGPQTFIDRVNSDLLQGSNVILYYPTGLSIELRRALKTKVSKTESISWRDIDLTEQENGERPLSLLSQYFCQHHNVYSVSSLIESKILFDYVIWVEGISNRYWTEWKEFISSYEHEIRSNPGNHGVFCLSLSAEQIRDELPQDVALRLHKWYGVSGSLDMSLFTAQILRNSGLTPLRYRLYTALCAELAGYDPVLAQHLASLDLGQLLNPMEKLLEYAINNRWDKVTTENPCWENGLMDSIDDRKFTHSAVLALNGDQIEINNRIWRAQVAVLFPYIEDLRQRLLPSIKRFIKLPIVTEYGDIISQYEDMEVGRIHHHIRRTAISKQVVNLFECLKTIRHAIAHLESIPPSVIEDLERLERHVVGTM